MSLFGLELLELTVIFEIEGVVELNKPPGRLPPNGEATLLNGFILIN